MAKVVRTYSELLTALNQAKDNALKGAAEKAVDVVKERVDKDVYAAGTPFVYERTYQLRDRLDVVDFRTSGNASIATIGHDTSKMTSVGYLAQHASVVDGSSSVHSIAEIVHDGKAGHILGSGFWTKARPYMANSIIIMGNGKYREFMLEMLRKGGHNVV